ncbi:MAG: hypothetical protein WA110_04060 [Anaerolineaceae bacterium]
MIKEKSGKTDYSFTVARDITDQKQVEQALRKTLDRTHEQFYLSRRMSLARKPEGVLKTLMSRMNCAPPSGQPCFFMIFQNLDLPVELN